MDPDIVNKGEHLLIRGTTCVGCFRWNARGMCSILNKLWRNYSLHEFLDGNKGYTLFLVLEMCFLHQQIGG